MSAKTFASSGFELSMVKKSGLVLLTRPLFMKILPQFYQTHLLQLTRAQYIVLSLARFD